MSWYKKANNRKYVQKIKGILKGHPFTKAVCSYYNIPLSDIDDNLDIEFKDLKGKFAEGNGKLIRLDNKLLDNRFFKDNFHFVIHEFFHWLKRRSEEKFYFNDPEEVQSFVLQIAWELIMGKTEREVIKKIYPILRTHFKDKNKLDCVFKEMLEKAKKLYDIYGGENRISIDI
jgi:hypothetical protein